MAATFLPPLDFACSERNLTTATTQSASQTIHSDHPEDDGNSEYETTTASAVVSHINETASVAASIQPGEGDKCISPNAQDCEPGDDSKLPWPFSRLLSRRGTANSRGSKKLAKRVPQKEIGDAAPECDTRVKRTWSIVSKKGGRQNKVRSYRCDIYAATSGDFLAALAECRQLVLEADGRLLDDFTYPGGFLFQLPSNATSPLANGDETAGGGRIGIAEWTDPFPQPFFNGLKLTPYGGAGELLVIPVPPHRSSAKQTRKIKVEQNEMAKKRVSSWVSSLATNYGNSMNHML
ncbi:hypothetical protein D0869_08642 [Hortaea werneckii]|uniref:Uncharacterized protein n=1 Tax=Hortaea werneckii TaxID=91943 RepID=A0A3M6WK43_HORWE|nr:hypothetical protein KC334_g670 [Hortaea werneckii]KAI7026498.1 hypothetical protein KC355_g632 [Hortaea werneckii]KAI7197579.1 hypothetical protein KC324_g4126 [Hortaea werneckii]KAI7589234.1 hypothetical protein KC316_g4060 [Hortaea werneckii]KAI7676214.1 hypothetical protein KC318_g421 [Hortaea werneckii]